MKTMTPEDAIKYCHTKAVLLVNIECYSVPVEMVVTRVADSGRLIKHTAMGFYGEAWRPAADCEVVEILETPDLPRPVKPLVVTHVPLASKPAKPSSLDGMWGPWLKFSEYRRVDPPSHQSPVWPAPARVKPQVIAGEWPYRLIMLGLILVWLLAMGWLVWQNSVVASSKSQAAGAGHGLTGHGLASRQPACTSHQ